MTKTLAQFQEAFRVTELVILKNEYWTWSLRPIQSTLGASVISLNEFSTRLSDAPDGAGKSYLEMVKIVERTLSKCFSYDKINHLMLMMVDSHVHYHVIPRYSSEQSKFDYIWTDEGWPAFPNITKNHFDNNEVLSKLVLQYIKAETNKG